MTGRFNLEPLQSAGYRRYLLATMLASLSLFVYQPSIEWVVLRETGSTAAVGFIEAVLIVPVAVATLPSGVLSDRFGARRLLAVSLGGIALAVGLAALLAAAGLLTFESAIVLTLLLGIFDGLYGVPVQQLLMHLVPARQLGPAIGLSMLTSGIGRLIGAPLGGAVLATFGPVPAFLPAAAGLVASVIVVLTIPVARSDEHQAGRQGVGDIRDSVRWLRREPSVLALTALGAIGAMFVFGHGALFPTITRDLLHADSAVLGVLTGAGGIGIILAALTLESFGRWLGRGRLVVAILLGIALAVGGLGFSGLLPVSVVLAGLLAGLQYAFGGTAQLLIQTIAPPRMRGRILALYAFVVYCILPVSTISIGVLADHLGVSAVLIGMAAATIIATILVALASPALLSIDIGPAGELRRRAATTAPAATTASPRAQTPADGVSALGTAPAGADAPLEDAPDRPS